jgi:hypothetical protein
MVKPTCTATAKGTGQRCRRAPLKGSDVCIMHGASAPQVRAAAAVRVAESAALAAYARHSPNGDSPVDVVAGLSALVAEVRRFADWAGQRIETLTATEWEPHDDRARAEFGLYERALDRAGRVLADVARLGIEARLASVTEQNARLLVRITEGALTDLGMDPRSPAVRAAIYARTRMHAPPPAGEGRD